jgi:hypothetical protein
MKNTLCALLLLLTGCGSGSEPANHDNHGYGEAYDVAGATGLRLRYTPVLKSGEVFADPALFEDLYSQVEACTGISAPPPFIILVPHDSLNHYDPSFIGVYLSRPSLILLYGDAYNVPRHEFIHYLLDMHTGNLDPTHKSPFFADVAAGGCA